jgi:hypothetical protein
MQTKTEDALGDKARTRAISAIEENAHLAELRGGHGEVVKIILDVIVRAIERGVPPGRGATENGQGLEAGGRSIPRDARRLKG